MDYAVITQALSRNFGDIEAVDSIDLRIPRGEIYGFLGPNGAGKTTLVRMLITLLMPSSGSATVAGYDIVRQPNDIRLRIGAALQDAALDLKQTGRELLRLQGRFYGLSRRDVDTRFDDLADLIDIGDAVDRLVGTYSGGMKRRLDLAASLIHNPEILFLDEPTTGLDPISRVRVWDEVRRVNRERDVTIFLTTQYLEEGRRAGRPRRNHQPRSAYGRGNSLRAEALVGQRRDHRTGGRPCRTGAGSGTAPGGRGGRGTPRAAM